jgi:prolyl-tRNA editing enzyme YbaK/EbsC (Cys-tRNA(Pro) deacylase)
VADGDPVLVVASGAHRVDPDVLAELFDVAEIRQASPEEVRGATGYPVGGVSPLGCGGIPIVLDEDLLAYDRIYAAGGDGNTLFEVDPRTLAESINAKVAGVAGSPSRAGA